MGSSNRRGYRIQFPDPQRKEMFCLNRRRAASGYSVQIRLQFKFMLCSAGSSTAGLA